MSKIRSRITERGNPKESAWPPEPEVGETRFTFGYWDKEQQKFVEGSPPVVEKYDTSAAIRTDDLGAPFYHEKAQKWVSTRSELNKVNAETNCITIDRPIRHDQESLRIAKRREASKIRKESYKRLLMHCVRMLRLMRILSIGLRNKRSRKMF